MNHLGNSVDALVCHDPHVWFRIVAQAQEQLHRETQEFWKIWRGSDGRVINGDDDSNKLW